MLSTAVFEVAGVPSMHTLRAISVNVMVMLTAASKVADGRL